MEQNPDSLSPQEWGLLFATGATAVLLYIYWEDVQHFKDYILSLNLWVYLIWLIALIIIFVLTHILVKVIQAISQGIADHYKQKKHKKAESLEIEDLLEKDFVINEEHLMKGIEELKNKIRICKQDKNNHFIPRLKKRLEKAGELLGQARQKQFAEDLDKEISQKRIIAENLDKEIVAKEQHEKSMNKTILWKLEAEDNPVFLKKDLNEKEINALTENGYFSISEYCIIQKKLIRVLVKPKLNHSPTHAFLVWNSIKLLERIKGVKNIKEYLTKEADIIFDFNGETFALEIEKGDLLYKKKQLKEKIAYLNKKFPNRWMFIVSNKNLLSKYKKLGPATPRKGVSEALAKMLKIAHPV